MIEFRNVLLPALATALCAAQFVAEISLAEERDRADMTMGNGEKNLIITEGTTKDGSTFTFPRVLIDGNGFLVIHPFANGKPVGQIYVGSTYIKDGENRNVAIRVNDPPESGEKYLVMLHRDVDENQVFDFNDGIDVPDVPVFEGNNMIAVVYVSSEVSREVSREHSDGQSDDQPEEGATN